MITICAREQQRLGAERAWHAQRGDQERSHGGEHRQTHRPLLGVDDAGEPRVPAPRPPQHAEHQERLEHPGPGGRAHEQRRALREREHEYEVEEQLERRHALAFAQDGADVRRVTATPAAHSAHL
jgi:hypothetical protein